MELNIRKATLSDLNKVVELWQKLFVDQMARDPYFKGSLVAKGGEKQFTDALTDQNCCIFLAEVDGSIVGFIEVWLYNRDFYFFVDDYAYILHFFIDEGVRHDRRIISINDRLFKAAEEWAIQKGRKYISADVFGFNQRVITLLEFVGLKIYRSRLVMEIGAEAGEKNE